jgi:hypothetical protein
MPWSTPFRDPITAPDGRALKTLRDAADYCTTIPKRAAMKPEWQHVAELLMKAEATGGMWIDMARIAILKALSKK